MVLCHGLLRIGPDPSTKDAKLIAFRVGEYNPRRVTLPDIGPPSTEGKETFDFCGLIDRTEVRGTPLFPELGATPVQFEPVAVIEGTGVTHLRYRVKK